MMPYASLHMSISPACYSHKFSLLGRRCNTHKVFAGVSARDLIVHNMVNCSLCLGVVPESVVAVCAWV